MKMKFKIGDRVERTDKQISGTLYRYRRSAGCRLWRTVDIAQSGQCAGRDSVQRVQDRLPDLHVQFPRTE